MGYYVGDFFDTVIQNSDANDFWEMMLHHIVTITLFGGMIMQNQMRVGVLISFLHNSTDIMAGATRAFSQTTLSNCTLVTFFICVAQWIYCRNYVLVLITRSVFYNVKFAPELKLHEFLSQTLGSFLVILCLMHLYWTSCFFRMIFSYSKTGSDENIINKTEVHQKQA